MTCPSHTTNEHCHTAPPQIVQSTAQPAHNTHTAYIMRCSLTELKKRLSRSVHGLDFGFFGSGLLLPST